MSNSKYFVLALILFGILFLFRKRTNFLKYQLFCATIYLFLLSFIQTLDLTLVIYLIFAILPNIKYFKVEGITDFLFLLYFGAVLIISVCFNGASNAISIFIIRFIGLLFFTYFFKNITLNASKDKEKKYIGERATIRTLFLFLICELIITLLGYYISGGDSRLMLNYQCTVGNISIAGALMVGYYLNICKNKNKIIGFLFIMIFTAISILSGTRGYLIICLALTVLYLWLYCNTLIKVLGCMLCLLVLLLFPQTLYDNFMEHTRLGTSTGRRTSEDHLVWNYMPTSPVNMIVGYGFGRKVSTLPNISYYITKVSDTSYTNYILYRVSGFHNLYTTIYYSSGLLGIIITLFLFAEVLKIPLKCVKGKKIKIVLISYIALYMFVLWFRWSATSGILEFATFAYIMANIVDYEKYNDKSLLTSKS